MIDLTFFETHGIIIALWIASSALSIGLAVGINVYRNRRENNLRKHNEEFFVIQIKNNLEKMMLCFIDVEKETIRDEEYATSNEDLMSSLKSYYARHEQEMKDMLHQTKLYLPFWTNLSTHDKKIINDILDMFSWLLYDYYQPTLPKSLCENTVLNSRKTLCTKKENTVKNTYQILDSYDI